MKSHDVSESYEYYTVFEIPFSDQWVSEAHFMNRVNTQSSYISHYHQKAISLEFKSIEKS